MTKPEKTLTKGQRTYNEILEATTRCIAQIGVEGTSITAIAEEAGVSRSLVAYHFPKKKLIFKEVLKYISAQGLSEIEIDVSKLSPEEQIRHVYRSNFEFFLRHRHYFKCFFLFYYMASIDAEYRKMNSELTQRAISRFHTLPTQLAKGRSSRSQIDGLSESLHETLIGSVQRFFIVNHTTSPEAYIRQHLAELDLRLKQFKKNYS
jgi:AcrR family transcriptional regulator